MEKPDYLSEEAWSTFCWHMERMGLCLEDPTECEDALELFCEGWKLGVASMAPINPAGFGHR